MTQTSFLGKPVVVLKGAALSIEMRYNVTFQIKTDHVVQNILGWFLSF